MVERRRYSDGRLARRPPALNRSFAEAQQVARDDKRLPGQWLDHESRTGGPSLTA